MDIQFAIDNNYLWKYTYLERAILGNTGGIYLKSLNYDT